MDARHDVSVRVQRKGRARMAESLGDNLRLRPAEESEAGEGSGEGQATFT